jgi:hypothetical protein
LVGIILERRMYPDLNRKEYLIAYGFAQEAWCSEEEISEDKIII